MNKKKIDKKNKFKTSFTQRLSDGLEIPKEAIYDMPYVTLFGNKEIRVENFINIVCYETEMIQLKTTCGLLVIEGKNLLAKQMDHEAIQISGCIIHVGFLN